MSGKMLFLICTIILLLSVTPAAELYRIGGNEGSATASPVPVRSEAKQDEGQLVRINMGDNNDHASIRNRGLVTRWSNLYMLSAWIYAVRQTSDGGYVLAGSSSIANVGSRAAFLMRIDSHGGIVWQKTYSTTDGYESSLTSVWQTSDGGFIAAGTRVVQLWIIKVDRGGLLVWQRGYGETMFDDHPSIQQTSDGGYIMAARSPVQEGQYWGTYYGSLLRLDDIGDVIWKQNFGGNIDGVLASAKSVQQTGDGGFIVGGFASFRQAGDWTTGAWLVKLTGNGNVTWQKEYTVASQDDITSAIIYSVKQTTDGGFIAGGATGFYRGAMWILRTDPNGAIIWQERLDNRDSTEPLTVALDTVPGGWFILGANIGWQQGGLVKLDGAGNLIWARATNQQVEELSSVQHTSDGGSIAAGTARLNGGLVPWASKLDANGLCCSLALSNLNLTVTKTSAVEVTANIKPIMSSVRVTTPKTISVDQLGTVFPQCPTSKSSNDVHDGGSDMEHGTLQSTWVKSYDSTVDGSYIYSIKQTSDGGYIGSGLTIGPDGKGYLWIFKLDANGNVAWENTYLGSDKIWQPSKIWQTREGGYILVGSIFTSDIQKALFLKIDSQGRPQWAETYGGRDFGDIAGSLVETTDGSYTIIGTRMTSPASTWPQAMHSWIVKLNDDGEILWQKLYAAASNADVFLSIDKTASDGYIVSGSTTPSENRGTISWVLTLDASGNILWQHTYSFRYNSWMWTIASDAHETSDGGYIVLGPDLMKLDHDGNTVWNNLEVNGFTMDKAPDGGYIISGFISFERGGDYEMLTKTDSMGNIEWQRLAGMQAGASVISTADGGYVIAGGQVQCTWMCGDYGSRIGPALILKLDSQGYCCNNTLRFIWDYGHVASPPMRTLIQTSDATVTPSDLQESPITVSLTSEAFVTGTVTLCQALVVSSNIEPD